LRDVFIDHGMQVFESTELSDRRPHCLHPRRQYYSGLSLSRSTTQGISPPAREIFHAQTP
jgi:hypothetical protein